MWSVYTGQHPYVHTAHGFIPNPIFPRAPQGSHPGIMDFILRQVMDTLPHLSLLDSHSFPCPCLLVLRPATVTAPCPIRPCCSIGIPAHSLNVVQAAASICHANHSSRCMCRALTLLPWCCLPARRCLQAEPRARPTAEEVYGILVALMGTPHRSYASASSRPGSLQASASTMDSELLQQQPVASPPSMPAAAVWLSTQQERQQPGNV
jgi:hypothetical protein